MAHEWKTLTLTLAAVAGFYAFLAFHVLSLDAMYSVDIAVKYVQAQVLADQGFRSLAIPYRARAIDPERRFEPFRPPYLLDVGGQVQAVWSSSTAVFNALFVSLWGYRGMVLASLVAAVLTLWLTASFSLDEFPAAIPIVLGLATPMWFFATIGWEHAPAVAFSTAAWVVVFRRGGAWRMFYAGLLLGAGAALREEVFLLAPGLALAVWWQATHRWRSLFGLLAGIAIVTAASLALEVWWFARPGAVHLVVSSHVLRDLFHLSGPARNEVHRFMSWRERYATVIQYWVLGYFNNGAIAVVAAAVAASAAIAFRWRIRWPILAAVALLTILAAVDTWTLLAAPRWLSGVYRLSPFLVFAALPMPSGARPADRFRTVVVVASAVFVATAFLAADQVGGKGFPRVLLPLVPLLAVSAWRAIVAYLRTPAPVAKWIGGLGLTLVALSLASQLGGVLPAYVARNAADGRVMDVIRRAPEAIVVAEDSTTAHSLLPMYFRKTLMLADSPVLAAALADRLDGWGVERLLMLARDQDTRLPLPGYEASDVLVTPDATILSWRRAPEGPPPAGEHLVTDLIEEFPHAVDVRPANGLKVVDAAIMGEVSRAIAVERDTASRITWEAAIPAHGWLEISMAVPPDASTRDGLMFSVGVTAGDDYQLRFVQIMDPARNASDRRWRHAAVDLSPYAGRRVRLVFNTRWWAPQTDGSTGAKAFWGAPRIVER